MLVLRLTAGELYDLEEALDVYEEERLDSYRKWLKIGSRGEAAFALRDFLRHIGAVSALVYYGPAKSPTGTEHRKAPAGAV